jgi:hypothetical protein
MHFTISTRSLFRQRFLRKMFEKIANRIEGHSVSQCDTKATTAYAEASIYLVHALPCNTVPKPLNKMDGISQAFSGNDYHGGSAWHAHPVMVSQIPFLQLVKAPFPQQ